MGLIDNNYRISPKFFESPITQSFPNMAAQNTDTFVYNLLNHQGLEVPGCYIELLSFPEADRSGQGIYFDRQGTDDKFTFTFNTETSVFEACLETDSETLFTLHPITNDEDEIIRFKVSFAQHPDVVAVFLWEGEGEEDELSDPHHELEANMLSLHMVEL